MENEAYSLLASGISNSALSLQVTTWEWDLFATTFPFLACIEQFDVDNIVIKREIVKVTNRVWDIATIVRSFGTCVQSDLASPRVQGNTAYQFATWSKISNYVIAEDIQDVKNEVARLETDKLDTVDFQNSTPIYWESAVWSDSYAITPSPAISAYTAGQRFIFKADVGNTGACTLNVNAKWAKTIKKMNDRDTETGDIEAWMIVEVVYDGTNLQLQTPSAVTPTPDIDWLVAKTAFAWPDDEFMIFDADDSSNKKIPLSLILWGFWDWSDGNVTISWTVTMTRDMYYNNLDVSWANILDPNGYRIFVRGKLTGDWKIQRNGNAWGNGTDWGPASWGTPWAWGTALNSWSLNADIAWSIGWVWAYYFSWQRDATAGTAGLSNNPSYSTTNGVAGGNGWGKTNAGAWGTSTRGSLYNIASLNNMFALCCPASYLAVTTQYKGISWSGAWGGGASDMWTFDWGWAWGWSWSNWGFIRIAVYEIDRTGTFESIWGDGWDWGNGNSTNNWSASWWGAWSGGSGWVVRVMYSTKTNIWSSTLTWGSPWTWGTPWPTGWSSWADWTAWNAGVLIEVAV